MIKKNINMYNIKILYNFFIKINNFGKNMKPYNKKLIIPRIKSIFVYTSKLNLR